MKIKTKVRRIKRALWVRLASLGGTFGLLVYAADPDMDGDPFAPHHLPTFIAATIAVLVGSVGLNRS